MTGHSRDRVAAGARRIQGLPTALGHDAERVSRLVLDAADEFDRVAGVVRIDTRDAEFVVAVARKLGFSARSMAHDLRTVQRVFDAAAAVLAAGVGEQQGGSQS